MGFAYFFIFHFISNLIGTSASIFTDISVYVFSIGTITIYQEKYRYFLSMSHPYVQQFYYCRREHRLNIHVYLFYDVSNKCKMLHVNFLQTTLYNVAYLVHARTSLPVSILLIEFRRKQFAENPLSSNRANAAHGLCWLRRLHAHCHPTWRLICIVVHRIRAVGIIHLHAFILSTTFKKRDWINSLVVFKRRTKS